MNIAAKFFEVRADGVFLPVMAVGLSPDDRGETSREAWLIQRAGRSTKKRVILLIDMTSGQAWWDIANWTGRDLTFAHAHLYEHWDEMRSGDVIDIEYLLGERKTVRISEQFQPKPKLIIKDQGAFK